MNTNFLSDWNLCSPYSKQDITYLMVNLRIYLEKNSNSGQYPTLSFFTNWLMHPLVDRKNTTQVHIQNLANKVSAHLADNSININLEIKEVLGIDTFKNELQSIFQSEQIPTQLFSQPNWKQFITTVLIELIERPVIYRQIQCPNMQYTINGFQLIDYEGAIWFELLSPEVNSINSRIVLQLPA